VYSLDSTAHHRDELALQLGHEFTLLVEQVNSYSEGQIDSNHRTSAAFRVVRHNVSRTDQQLPAFKNNKGVGLTMVAVSSRDTASSTH
jgi:hypothetical protein